MNLKTKTAAEPNLSRIVQGPSNVSSFKDMEINDQNGQGFVNDWGLFSQAILWIAQNGRDPACVSVAIDALKQSELLDLNTEENE